MVYLMNRAISIIGVGFEVRNDFFTGIYFTYL